MRIHRDGVLLLPALLSLLAACNATPAPPTIPPATVTSASTRPATVAPPTATASPSTTRTASATASATATWTSTPTPSASATPAMATSTPAPATPTPVPVEVRALEDLMVEAVNVARRASGLPPYEMDPQLRLIARQHSEDMVRRDYFSHVTPEGITLWDRLARHGLAPRWAGENIQRNSRAGTQSVEYAVQWFMNSTPHRKNILHRHYTHIGVGVALDQAEPGDFTFTTFTLVFAQLP